MCKHCDERDPEGKRLLADLNKRFLLAEAEGADPLTVYESFTVEELGTMLRTAGRTAEELYVRVALMEKSLSRAIALLEGQTPGVGRRIKRALDEVLPDTAKDVRQNIDELVLFAQLRAEGVGQ